MGCENFYLITNLGELYRVGKGDSFSLEGCGKKEGAGPTLYSQRESAV